jgi:hypothetical protein
LQSVREFKISFVREGNSDAVWWNYCLQQMVPVVQTKLAEKGIRVDVESAEPLPELTTAISIQPLDLPTYYTSRVRVRSAYARATVTLSVPTEGARRFIFRDEIEEQAPGYGGEQVLGVAVDRLVERYSRLLDELISCVASADSTTQIKQPIQ